MTASGFYVRRSGYTHVGELMLAVIADLTTNGFTVKHPTVWTPPVGDPARSKFKVTLEAGAKVDPLNSVEIGNKQSWRLQVEVFDKFTAGITAGSQQALRDDGVASYGIKDGQLVGPQGALGGFYTKTPTSPSTITADPSKPEEGFISRSTRVQLAGADLSDSFPMTYHLCITPRGIMLCVWEDYVSDSGAAAISWFLIQRPVDRANGSTIITGKAPLFAVYGVNNKIKRFVVRESDVLRPSDAVDATVDTDYHAAIINGLEQVAISEGNKYVVSFPSRLNTTRYAYTYELDMLGYTSADVISENTDVPLTVYKEAAPRIYVSLLANGANNTGMRIVALKSGGGIASE